jgi:predicted DNA-binding ribbon-helix-helix protein
LPLPAGFAEKIMKSPISRRSIVNCRPQDERHLEDEFWNGLKEIAVERGMTVPELVAGIDGARQHANLS